MSSFEYDLDLFFFFQLKKFLFQIKCSDYFCLLMFFGVVITSYYHCENKGFATG